MDGALEMAANRNCFSALLLQLAVGVLSAAGSHAQTDAFRVINVASGDFLAMRAAPNAEAKLVGKIPPDAKNIIRIGQCTDWCRVRYEGREGWVNRRYLAVTTTVDLPAKLGTSRNPLEDCNSDEAAKKLAGCTALIDKGGLTDTELALTYSRRSDALIERGSLEEALADRLKALILQPNDADYQQRASSAFVLRASVRFAKGIFKDALSDYDSAILLVPTNSQAKFQRSSVYLATKDFDKAIDDARSALSAQPNNVLYKGWLSRVFEARAIEYAQNKKLPEAIADFSEALQLEPGRVGVLMARAKAHAATGEGRRAVEDLSEILRINSESAEAYVWRGEIHYAQGNLLMCISDMNRAIDLEPRNLTALVMRAFAREANEQREMAREDFRAVLRIDPSHKLAKAGVQRLEASARK